MSVKGQNSSMKRVKYKREKYQYKGSWYQGPREDTILFSEEKVISGLRAGTLLFMKHFFQIASVCLN